MPSKPHCAGKLLKTVLFKYKMFSKRDSEVLARVLCSSYTAVQFTLLPACSANCWLNKTWLNPDIRVANLVRTNWLYKAIKHESPAVKSAFTPIMFHCSNLDKKCTSLARFYYDHHDLQILNFYIQVMSLDYMKLTLIFFFSFLVIYLQTGQIIRNNCALSSLQHQCWRIKLN